MLIRSAILVAATAGLAWSADPAFPPVPENQVRRYTALRTIDPIQLDGRLDERSWSPARKSARFVDLISGLPTIHETRVAVTWDDDNLYVGFWVEEPLLTASLTNRDDPIYENNDVELFIAGKHAYYEFEVNSYGTIYEALFVWQDAYRKHGFDREPQLDRSQPSVRCQEFNGVGLNNHPRGLRWGFLRWDYPGARAKVHLDGTINDATDRDRGWTVELSFPWDGMRTLMRGDGRAVPPQDGDEWRIHFSRFNQYKEAAPVKDSGGWALSPHGVWDSHIPECFPKVRFSKKTE